MNDRHVKINLEQRWSTPCCFAKRTFNGRIVPHPLTSPRLTISYVEVGCYLAMLLHQSIAAGVPRALSRLPTPTCFSIFLRTRGEHYSILLEFVFVDSLELNKRAPNSNFALLFFRRARHLTAKLTCYIQSQ
jgi:hypothetical protein